MAAPGADAKHEEECVDKGGEKQSSDHQDSESSANVEGFRVLHGACLVAVILGYGGAKTDLAGQYSELLTYSPGTTAKLDDHWKWLCSYQVICRITIALTVLFVVAACREANRFPRLSCHGTPWLLTRTVLQFCGDLFLAPVRCFSGKERPTIDFQRTKANSFILERCPTLKDFKQTPWLHNAYLSFLVLLWLDAKSYKRSPKFVERENIRAPDGGVVAIDWWHKDGAKNASKSPTPNRILFIGSTFTGDANPWCVADSCEYFSTRGWFCAVQVKRGCGICFPNLQPKEWTGKQPKPWCLSGLDDVVLCIDHIAAKYPDVPICGIGYSTGGGQLRNYVNGQGSKCKLSACAIVDVATSWGPAFEDIDSRAPLLSKVLNSCAVTSLGNCNREVIPVATLRKQNPETWENEPHILPGGLLDWTAGGMAPAHGFAPTYRGAMEYMASCQPAPCSGCQIPTLELLTYNDTLMPYETVDSLRSWHQDSPNLITAITREGAHMVRWEGFSPKCWIKRVVFEFSEAVLELQRDEKVSCPLSSTPSTTRPDDASPCESSPTDSCTTFPGDESARSSPRGATRTCS